MPKDKLDKLSIKQLGYLKEAELQCLFKDIGGLDSIEYVDSGKKIVFTFTDAKKMHILKSCIDENLGEESKLFNLEFVYKEEAITAEDIAYLFTGSKHFSRIYTIEIPFKRTFVGFKKEAVQYYSDDFSKPSGKTTTVMENLASKYLKVSDPFFTEEEDPLN